MPVQQDRLSFESLRPSPVEDSCCLDYGVVAIWFGVQKGILLLPIVVDGFPTNSIFCFIQLDFHKLMCLGWEYLGRVKSGVINRKINGKRSALAYLAGNMDGTIVSLDKFLHYC